MGRRSYYDTDEERLPEGMTRIGYDADEQTYTFRDADGSIWESAPGSRYSGLTKIQDAPTPASSSGSNRHAKGGDEEHGAYNDDDDNDDDDQAPFLAPPAYSASAAAASLSTRGGNDDALPMPTTAAARHREWRRRSWRADLMPLLHFFMLASLFLVGVFWMVGGFSGRSADDDNASKGAQPTAPPATPQKPPAIAPVDCPSGWTTSVVYRGQTCYMISKMYAIELNELLDANKGLICDNLQIGEKICVPKSKND